MGGISIWQLLIIAVIVVLLFGTNKLRGMGADLGASIKGFKKAMGDEDKPTAPQADKTGQDADFAAKTIAEKPQPPQQSQPDESVNKDNKQV
ncbi:Sec-independent protein translocase subunit TatA [Acerihabitans arboris]|uniref:Sec-independent protein translocase protein TatA n=1 Tax=Acerihabitans arboris TaxID=2691583 RepID=A0A845SKM4_9GAMM|nr:Sec-independent protein translocase subunit TatA [Acerihabitans arboris]NDL64529.1 twin-arginine translocase TatA/TatE family subunit [Acerihabitans arboris]